MLCDRSMYALCTLRVSSVHAPCTLRARYVYAPSTLRACFVRAPWTLHARSVNAPCTLHARIVHALCTIPAWSMHLPSWTKPVRQKIFYTWHECIPERILELISKQIANLIYKKIWDQISIWIFNGFPKIFLIKFSNGFSNGFQNGFLNRFLNRFPNKFPNKLPKLCLNKFSGGHISKKIARWKLSEIFLGTLLQKKKIWKSCSKKKGLKPNFKNKKI